MIEKGVIRIGELKIELARRLVTVSGKIVNFAPKEYDGYDRAVDTHIKKLRAALLDSSHRITTVIKKGYMWVE